MFSEPAALPSSSAMRRTDYGHQTRADLRCTHALSYGLTCDDYDSLRERAKDRCEICRRSGPETPRGELVIDHFHSEGQGLFFVRGLLCDRCNSVMQRHDGVSPWGPKSRPFAERARKYHLNAFGRPSAEVLARADVAIQRRAEHRRSRLSACPSAVRPDALAAPAASGLEVIARKLREELSPAQLSQLAVLLTNQTA